jgi:fructose-1,6-bisphosphatase
MASYDAASVLFRRPWRRIKACNPKGEYTVCWDPLDGSSIVDNNWAVGTMIGIWQGGC